MKHLVVIVGSENDLKHCAEGLSTLYAISSLGRIIVNVHVKSVHRHTEKLLALLRAYSATGQIDSIIAGAGKAAHLPGCIDAYLRNHLGDTKIHVIGVAFTSGNKLDDEAAVLSITQVPGTQVIYAGQGSQGFKKACQMASVAKNLPEITLAAIPPDMNLTLDQARALAKEVCRPAVAA